MTSPVSFRIEHTDGPARAGVLSTPHGEVATPAFMPVGTRGSVRAVDPTDLLATGAAMSGTQTAQVDCTGGDCSFVTAMENIEFPCMLQVRFSATHF